jgi:hypothetical protein
VRSAFVKHTKADWHKLAELLALVEGAGGQLLGHDSDSIAAGGWEGGRLEYGPIDTG